LIHIKKTGLFSSQFWRLKSKQHLALAKALYHLMADVTMMAGVHVGRGARVQIGSQRMVQKLGFFLQQLGLKRTNTQDPVRTTLHSFQYPQ
jgi:hypothetical protein